MTELTFTPPWWLRNGHVQTLLGHLLPSPRFPLPTRQHVVRLPDGDAVVAHDAVPSTWADGQPMTLLIHGLGGSHQSGNVKRLARALVMRGVRAVRVDLRGSGAGLGLARKSYHGGCTPDVRAVLHEMHCWSPESPLWLLGISLGGNIALKLAGELTPHPVPGLRRVVAVSPPADLPRCVELLCQRRNRLYEKHFLSVLVRQTYQRQWHFPDLPEVRLPWRLTIRHFDDLVTAPMHGFADAQDYYRQAAAEPYLASIKVPTLVLTSRDDPFITVEPFERMNRPASMTVRIVDHGGHLGFLGADGAGGMRWAEQRVVEWLTQPDPEHPDPGLSTQRETHSLLQSSQSS